MKLNKEQQQAVEHTEGPLLIVAGAGTGKTTLLSERFSYLINNKFAKPNEILCLVFNEDATNSLEDKITDKLDTMYPDLWVHTFHGFCDRILRLKAIDIGLCDDYKILKENQAWIILKQNLERFDLDYYKPMGNQTKYLDDLTRHFKACKEEGIYPEQYQEYAETSQKNHDDYDENLRVKEIAKAYATYQKVLLENNCLDFGDLLNYCLKLFKERPSILKQYREKFKYILVDEFQDTNKVQYEIVKILAEPRNNLTVVGDDDQSIYRFRGAAVENVIDFCKDYQDSKKIILKENYRSTQEVLDLAYKSIQNNNPNRLEYYLQNDNDLSKEFNNLDDLKKLSSNKKEKGDIVCSHYKTAEEEEKYIIDTIKNLKENWKKTDEDYKYPDFAILVRTNAQGQRIANAFKTEGIDYFFSATKGFYQKQVILDSIAYLKLLDNYHENSALMRILDSPVIDLSFEDYYKISEFSRKKTISLYEAIKLVSTIKDISKAAVKKCDNLISLVQKHTQALKDKSIVEIYAMFLNDFNYFDYILKLEKTNPYKAKETFDLIEQFLSQIKDFQNTSENPSVKEFVSHIDYELSSGEKGDINVGIEPGLNQVQIMTIHKAKGLEYNHVFIPAMHERHFPSDNRKDSIQIPKELINGNSITFEGDDKEIHIQEERRLFYVALTRSRYNVYLSWADGPDKRPKKVSRFVHELNFDISSYKTIEHEKKIEIKEQPAKKINYKLPSALSYSQIAAFNNCPLQYKYRYILNISPRGKASLTFGKVMHGAIEAFCREYWRSGQNDLFNGDGKKEIPTEKRLLELYGEKWRDEWYEDKIQKEKYKKQGEKSLKVFYANFKEKPINFAIIDGEIGLEYAFNANFGGTKLKGKIDRIDELADGSIRIVDYKTGEPKEKLAKKDKEQLIIYQIIAENLLNRKVSELTYYYLTNGAELSFTTKDKEKDEVLERIEEIINEIKESQFLPTPGFNCKYCDYNGICEFKA